MHEQARVTEVKRPGGMEASLSGYRIMNVDDMRALHHGLLKLAGAELGLEAFGLQVLDIPAGFGDYPAHDHAEDGQEEVYVVLHGQATFEIEGEAVRALPGHILFVGPGTRRGLRPPERDVRILAVGGVPGASYERPVDFELTGGTR